MNREYYDRLTDGQDDYWRLMAAPRFRVATILEILSRRPPHRLVDLGCGNGQLLSEIAAQHPGASLAGIDLSAGLVQQNASGLAQMAWYERDLQLPIAGDDALTGAFDTIVCSEVIEHLDQPEVLLANARRLASPEARLILTTQSGTIRVTEREVGHRQHFTIDSISALLRANGWTPDRVWNAGFPFHDLSKWGANLAPHRTLRGFGTARYGAGQRFVCAALRVAFRFNSSHRGAQLFAVAVRA